MFAIFLLITSKINWYSLRTPLTPRLSAGGAKPYSDGSGGDPQRRQRWRPTTVTAPGPGPAPPIGNRE